MKKIIDAKEEKTTGIGKSLLDLSEKNNSVLLSLIAPYVGRKVSPTKTAIAHMGISEEFAIESVIDQIKEQTDCKNLMLLVNSPGGLVQSSYKVARALGKAFDEIVVFVPHVAASGGTLIALTGDKIVMGMMSQLSPLDPQRSNDDGVVSANSVVEAHSFVTSFFEDKEVDDAPYTYRVLADKFSAVEIRDALANLSLMMEYICEILEGSGYDQEKREEIADKLVHGFKTHGEVINLDKAKKCGLNVVSEKEYPEEWKIFREWLGEYLLKSADKHIIRFVISETLKRKVINEKVTKDNSGDDSCQK